MKTREQLRDEGIELHGLIVPEWFKEQCDACSVPRGLRWIAKADQAHAPCVIHDWMYYLIQIAYRPKDEYQRNRWRMIADFELRVNRALVMKYKWIGWLYGAIYFSGVRVVGKRYVYKPRIEILNKSPKTNEQLCELYGTVREYFPDYDRGWLDSIYDDISETIEQRKACGL